MKGDFSRRIFDAAKHYSGVLMQQGRVQLDADWNEQQAIGEHRTLIEARDVIGGCGAPRAAPGFAITASDTQLRIGAGRFYVDGILCENETEIAFGAQPHLPNTPDIRAALEQAQATLGIAYLDVWQRHITVLDDQRLRETALGGPDTTTRVQTVWQVKFLPVNEDDRGGARLRELLARRAELVQKQTDTAQSINTLNEQLAQLQTRLAQLPPGSIQRRQLQQQIARVNAAIQQQQATATEVANDLQEVEAAIKLLRDRSQVRCDTSFKEWDALFAPSGTLNARTQPPVATDNPCELPPAAGYRRLENQLYRVEVHQGGALGTATFKWSRDNGTVVAAIERISGSSIVVADLGPDETLGFAPGQWVELSDDALELNCLPGQLGQIESVNQATREITLLGAVPNPLDPGENGVDLARHPKLRRWDFVDQPGAPANDQAVATTGDWLPLEDGIAVQFAQAAFRSGDFWLIPARTGTGEIEWPPFVVPNIAPIPQPPLGIEHHYCRLALIRLEDGNLNVISDCRAIFDPLTEQATADALHVTSINWRNDDAISTAVLLREGLRITLDTAPNPDSIGDANVVVELETAFNQNREGGANNQFFQRLIIRGDVGVDASAPNVIVWKVNQPQVDNQNLRTVLAATAEEPAQPATSTRGRKRTTLAAAARTVAPINTLRMRITLKGRQIWQDSGKRRLFLDGQVFGAPGQRRNGQVCNAIVLPSGDNAKASDFESWFYLGGEQRDPTLTATRLRILRVANGETELDSFELPSNEAITVDPKEGNVVEMTFNRAPNPDGFVANGNRQAMRLSLLSGNQEKLRIVGDLSLKETVARFVLREPDILTVGRYRIVMAGSENQELQPVRAADDGVFLDGNYDGQAGGDFSLDFNVR